MRRHHPYPLITAQERGAGIALPQRTPWQQQQGGDIKDKSAASSAITTTNLQTLASSQDGLSGWSSASFANSNNWTNFFYGGTFTTAAANRQNGLISIFVIAALNDTPLYPAVASGTIGTEGAITFTDTEERDSICTLLKSIVIDNTNSAIYTFPQMGIAQLFDGVPTHHALYITQNATTTTTAGLASAAIYQTGKMYQYT